MKNKVVCLLLIFSLLFSTNLTMALEKEPLPTPLSITLEQKTQKPSPSVKKNCYIKKGTCALITSVTSLLFLVGGSLGGYLMGYKNGQKIKLNSLKDITLEGFSSAQSGDIPSGKFEPIPFAQKYIKDVLRNEIPKLEQSDKFKLNKLSAIEIYLRLIEGCSESKKLNSELETLSRRMQGFIFHKSTITLGTLTDLITDAQELVDRVYEDVYKQK